ncbi:SanA/YdcF family protein [Fibrisoma montanum]|uniref:SanA/YdcF family protein n=1 Tax=Fibrisoma montanum TaxID=2305895 RepID=UPI0018F6EBA6|nr:ElyC/SanA/YdcF family protein [Fibrisoma montanum]
MNPTLYTTDYSGDKHHEMTWVRAVKRLVKGGIVLGFVGVTTVLICNWWVVYSTRDQIYFNIDRLPSNDVGLVLGTSKFVRSGKENLFFRYRMEATARLFKEGKVKYLILSGNNDSEYYNEPVDMKRALLKLGVPETVMLLDYAGYRTFDSVVRCREVFNQQKITIISQNFHNARALYIGNHEGIEAVAFAAQDVPDGYSLRTLIREYLARPYAILDVHIVRPQPEKGNWERKKPSPAQP